VTDRPRVLVTGGAGFIGSHLVEELVHAGNSVSVLDDLSRGSRDWLPAGTDLHVADVRDEDAVRDVVARVRPEAVAHLAALHYIPAVDDAPELAHSINVVGTRNVLAACRAAPPATLLFASTAAVYPDRPDALTEQIPPGPIDLYGRTKLEGERDVERFAAETGVRCAIARIFNVVGPRETNPHIVPEIVDQLRAGSSALQLGNLEPRRDLTDVRDVAAALARLVLGAPAGVSVFNVGTGRALSVLELVQECERIVGRTVKIEQVRERIRPVERESLIADTTHIAERLGWRPQRDVRATLAELISG
jgi:UDP-glucose 4-epimerase